jgi:hypothetical protein
MPLTEGDVLDTLSDPVALGIEFYADKIHVKGEYLTTVRDHIRAGNILVKGGTEDLAWDASCRHREEAKADAAIQQSPGALRSLDRRVASLLAMTVHAFNVS